jgi:hypothetical protein
MRPTTVKVTTWIMATLAASTWAGLFSIHSDDVRALGIVVLTFYSGYACKALIAYWQGKNWARQAVIVFSIYIIARFPLEKAKPSALLQAIDWVYLVMAVFLPVYLNSREARTFFGALYQERPSAVAQQ